MFSFFTGRKFCGEIARLLGVDSGFLGSVMLEVGFTWAHFKALKRADISAGEALNAILPSFEQGLVSMKSRFGSQSLILEAEQAIVNYRLKIKEVPMREDISSDECPGGRYKLSYEVPTGEMLRGKHRTATYGMHSDDLEELEAIALVKKMGGVSVLLVDQVTSKIIMN
ncbi:hypothetical protein [Magnetospirillum gryphiswaldense]|uniref:hypothetical protein n=1 Tax=Magnetospirillum gryphiswaldense TaxID=55518 RepID=UPI0011835042|nr:hypothetical protein [Magnetospirillum gryphiswaldense]